jgi:hypothetical protein
MADLSDSAIADGVQSNSSFIIPSDEDLSAYEDVRDDKSETNWMLLNYQVRVYLPPLT